MPVAGLSPDGITPRVTRLRRSAGNLERPKNKRRWVEKRCCVVLFNSRIGEKSSPEPLTNKLVPSLVQYSRPVTALALNPVTNGLVPSLVQYSRPVTTLPLYPLQTSLVPHCQQGWCPSTLQLDVGPPSTLQALAVFPSNSSPEIGQRTFRFCPPFQDLQQQ